PLLMPVPFSSDGLHVGQTDWLTAVLDGRQKEDLFLDIGSQVEKIHNLADTSATHVPEASQRGLIGYQSGTKQAIKANGQGHEPGNAGQASSAFFGAWQYRA